MLVDLPARAYKTDLVDRQTRGEGKCCASPLSIGPPNRPCDVAQRPQMGSSGSSAGPQGRACFQESFETAED